jgi:putative flippase GtrA
MTEGAPAVPADRAQHVPGQADGVSVSHPDHRDLAAPANGLRDAEATCPPRGDLRRRETSRLLRFACVGIASTVAYSLLYLAFSDIGVTAQAANAVSLFLAAVFNTAANRRVTFGIRGSAHAGRHQVQGLIAFGAGLAVTSAALAVLHAVSARPARIVEVSVLVTATLVATVVRYALYRSWVFQHGRRRP